MNKKDFDKLKKRVGKLGKDYFKKFEKEIQIKNTKNIKTKILKILISFTLKYKKEKDESTKEKLISVVEKELIKSIGFNDKQMNKIIGESLIEVLKSLNDVIEHSVNDRQLEIGYTQLMTTYANILNTNLLKVENKDVINSIVTSIQDNLDGIGKFWIYDGEKYDYFNKILNIILSSIKVNRFEEEWGLEIIQEMMKDNIERYSSFIPQGMIIIGLELMLNDIDIDKHEYNKIVTVVKGMIKD